MPLAVDFETIPQLFTGLMERYRDSGRAVLVYKDKRTKAWTDIPYAALEEQVRAFAGFLLARGLAPGDRVALLSENRPEWAVTDLGTQLAGAVNVPLYTTVPASQVAYIVRDSGARVLVVSTGLQLRKADRIFEECPALEVVVTMAEPRKERAEARVVRWDDALAEGAAYLRAHRTTLDARAAAVTPDDLSAIIYTSGTTGLPKGVALTHANLCSNARAAHELFDLYETDRHLSFLPLSHAFERTAGYTALLAAGASIAYAESIDAVSKNLPEVSPTVMVSVPRLFERVYNMIQKSVQEGSPVKRGLFAWAVRTGKARARAARAGRRPGPLLAAQAALAHRLVFARLHEKLGGRVRFAISGGAALPREIGEFFEAAGVRLIEGYGLSETSPVLAANPPDAPVYGTVGHVYPGVTIAIRDLHSGRLVGQLSGSDYPSSLTTGTGEILAKGPGVMRGYWNNPEATAEVFDADGWFHTGDVGRFEDGYLRITDRIKHMIVSKGGKNIYPGPIEEQFATHPLVEQVMVVGEGREFLTALVVPALDALRAEARVNGLDTADTEALLAHPDTRARFASLFADYSRQAASHERIRDFRFVPEPFSVENDLLTPTMKLKRRAIEQRYAALVESMYAEVV
ncbi:MAG: AMP-dependent synthetase/ligase [Rubricoccaceae bacterium]